MQSVSLLQCNAVCSLASLQSSLFIATLESSLLHCRIRNSITTVTDCKDLLYSLASGLLWNSTGSYAWLVLWYFVDSGLCSCTCTMAAPLHRHHCTIATMHSAPPCTVQLSSVHHSSSLSVYYINSLIYIFYVTWNSWNVISSPDITLVIMPLQIYSVRTGTFRLALLWALCFIVCLSVQICVGAFVLLLVIDMVRLWTSYEQFYRKVPCDKLIFHNDRWAALIFVRTVASAKPSNQSSNAEQALVDANYSGRVYSGRVYSSWFYSQ